ncbi:MAG: hypothetical protein GY871_15265 [Actinomycetales bacterium]|nr:hypothetical protein [Actinomycetales bacterium]
MGSEARTTPNAPVIAPANAMTDGDEAEGSPPGGSTAGDLGEEGSPVDESLASSGLS